MLLLVEHDAFANTVVPVMNGHPRDQAKVSVHCRWPLIRGTDGQTGTPKDVTFPTWCRKTNVTNEGVDLPQSCG